MAPHRPSLTLALALLLAAVGCSEPTSPRPDVVLPDVGRPDVGCDDACGPCELAGAECGEVDGVACGSCEGGWYCDAATRRCTHICQATPIDVLFVIDNSASMCDQRGLVVAGVDTFQRKLETTLRTDLRVAVTTMDADCDPSITTAAGEFNRAPATSENATCGVKVAESCQEDADCDDLGYDGQWHCERFYDGVLGLSCQSNFNQTPNSRCHFVCQDDLDCVELTGGPDYTCAKPSSDPQDWRCVEVDDTGECPPELPTVLSSTPDQAGFSIDEHFHCAAAVGHNEASCYRYEQGLRTAWEALDPQGLNAGQARAFLRDEAFLVIVFISDDDDCSVEPGETLGVLTQENCSVGEMVRAMDLVGGDLEEFNLAVLDVTTTDQGGLLVPVETFAERYRSLKEDPSRVVVAAVVGDSLATDEALRTADRTGFVTSLGSLRECWHDAFICDSDEGTAQWGFRFQQLVDQFGDNGVFYNICGPDGVVGAIDGLAEKLAELIRHRCGAPPLF